MLFRFAYIDPGTGSFVLQAVIGTILGVGYTVRRQIATLVGKITGKNKVEKPAEADDRSGRDNKSGRDNGSGRADE